MKISVMLKFTQSLRPSMPYINKQKILGAAVKKLLYDSY